MPVHQYKKMLQCPQAWLAWQVCRMNQKAMPAVGGKICSEALTRFVQKYHGWTQTGH